MQAAIVTERDEVDEVVVLYRPRGGPERVLRVTPDPLGGAIARVGDKRVWLEGDRLEPVARSGERAGLRQ